ncbi:MAG: hypothetical protein ACYCY8_13230 [Burkholderiales bacterium]
MSTHNPYLKTCQAWVEHYGDSLFRAKTWRIVATLAPGLAGISVAGVAYIRAHSKVQKK